MSDDNNETPKIFSLEDHKINREKDNGWAKKEETLASQPVQEDTTKPRLYEIHIKNGRPFEAYGVLMVTPVFVAIGDAAGNFKVVVPMESLDYVTNTEEFVDTQNRQS